ncbi:MAG: polysaccharide deacetylase family protein [Gammaproteobacteria bacterium]|nr:polysaccharide deacetylase family protein [Gammaproteobacteria bacterium]
MHGRNKLPKARTFAKDIVAWLVLLFSISVIYVGYWYWERDPVVDTRHSDRKADDSLLLVFTYGRITESGDGKFISQTQLKEHLHAIRAQGFVSVSIEQIQEFYHAGAALPAKSVLLLFEHGFLSTFESVDPVLRSMRWRATMTVSTQQIQERNTTFLYWDRLQRMLNSGLWDIASAGHAGYDTIPIDQEGSAGQALFHRRWIADQGQQEIDVKFRDRILRDYAYSKNLLEEKLSKLSAQAYVFPFGDLSKLSKDPLILRTNQEALTTNYSLGFVDNEFGINDHRSYPYRLNRRRITADWSAQRLTQHILAVQKSPMTTGQLDVVTTDWVVGVGETGRRGNRILLSGERRADMWVPGSQWAEYWKIEAELRLDGNQQFWIVQYDEQTPGAFWRWGGDAHALSLQYSPNGEKVETLRSFKKAMIPGEYHRVALSKRGQGIWVEWDNEPLTEHPVYLPGEWRGKVGWMAWNRAGQSQLELREPQLTLLPLRIESVNAYPSRWEVQKLKRQASELGALAVPRWWFDKGKFHYLGSDNDLLRLLAHRYGWKLIPTICIAPGGILNPTWIDDLKAFIQSMPNAQVHLDLRHITSKLELAQVSRLRDKFVASDQQLWLSKSGTPSAQPQQGSCDSIFEDEVFSLSKQAASST